MDNYIIIEDNKAPLPKKKIEDLVQLIFFDSCKYMVRLNWINTNHAK